MVVTVLTELSVTKYRDVMDEDIDEGYRECVDFLEGKDYSMSGQGWEDGYNFEDWTHQDREYDVLLFHQGPPGSGGEPVKFRFVRIFRVDEHEVDAEGSPEEIVSTICEEIS